MPLGFGTLTRAVLNRARRGLYAGRRVLSGNQISHDGGNKCAWGLGCTAAAAACACRRRLPPLPAAECTGALLCIAAAWVAAGPPEAANRPPLAGACADQPPAAADPCPLPARRTRSTARPACVRRSRRAWKPNAQNKRLYSEILGRQVQLRVTTAALRCVAWRPPTPRGCTGTGRRWHHAPCSSLQRRPRLACQPHRPPFVQLPMRSILCHAAGTLTRWAAWMLTSFRCDASAAQRPLGARCSVGGQPLLVGACQRCEMAAAAGWLPPSLLCRQLLALLPCCPVAACSLRITLQPN